MAISLKERLIKEAEKSESLANESVEEKSNFVRQGRDELLARAKAFRDAAEIAEREDTMIDGSAFDGH